MTLDQLIPLFHQVEGMKMQLEAVSQTLGAEIARLQDAAPKQQDEPATRSTFGRPRRELPDATQQP